MSVAPTVGMYLTADAWPDGELREKSTLIVFYEEGAFKVCLSDKDSGSVLWATAKSFGDLLESLEARLTDGAPDWRKGRKGAVKGR
jgi:hypothetical protein